MERAWRVWVMVHVILRTTSLDRPAALKETASDVGRIQRKLPGSLGLPGKSNCHETLRADQAPTRAARNMSMVRLGATSRQSLVSGQVCDLSGALPESH